EDAGGRVPPHLLRHPLVRVRVLAQRVQLALARRADAAGDGEGYDDPITDLELLHAASHLDDLAHELVAKDVTALHRRDEAVIKMQIRAADRGRRDLHDRVLLI